MVACAFRLHDTTNVLGVETAQPLYAHSLVVIEPFHSRQVRSPLGQGPRPRILVATAVRRLLEAPARCFGSSHAPCPSRVSPP